MQITTNPRKKGGCFVAFLRGFPSPFSLHSQARPGKSTTLSRTCRNSTTCSLKEITMPPPYKSRDSRNQTAGPLVMLDAVPPIYHRKTETAGTNAPGATTKRANTAASVLRSCRKGRRSSSAQYATRRAPRGRRRRAGSVEEGSKRHVHTTHTHLLP
ncbi:hypothetical protein LZ30DRAFT_96364 [Colletotrichum cereale]|nr:hypothetical protein LZ30DRAFT_96364 [Colletotrichum cereale]